MMAAQSALASATTSGTDLEVGKALLGASLGDASVGPSAVSMQSRVGAILGLNLSGLSGQDENLTEQSVLDGEAAFSAAPLFTAGGQPALAGFSVTSKKQGTAQLAVGADTSARSIAAIAQATMDNGWESSFAASLGRFHKSGGLVALSTGSMSTEQTQLYAELVKRFLVAQYFKAYFRNGKIFSVKLSTEKLKAALKSKLESTITDPALRDKVRSDIDSLSDDIVGELCGNNPNCLELGTIGDTTFTTRAGKNYGFAGIDVDVDPTGEKKISIKGLELSPELVSDLVRVFVEALGDYQFGVPGVPKSTACDFGYLCSTPAQADTIAQVDEIGDKVEASTSSIVGIAIRGGWIIALNNEALASGIQTAASVSFRKIAEKVAYDARSNQCPAAASGPAFIPVALTVN